MTLGQAYMFQHRQSSEQTFLAVYDRRLKLKAQRQGIMYYRRKKKKHPQTLKVLTPNDF